MRGLLQYLKPYKKESILGPFFKLLEAGFELIVPLVVAGMIDTGIKNHDLPYLLRCGGVLILLLVVGLLCSVTAQYFAAKAAGGFGTGLRNDLFRHIQYFSHEQLDTIGSATLISRLTNDTNQVQSCVNMVLRLFLRSPFIVLGAMIMAFTVDRKAAMVFVIMIPLLLFVVLFITLVTIPIYKKIQKQFDGILAKVRENLTGVRVIHAFNRQDMEEAEFKESSDMLQKTQRLAGKISAGMSPITYSMINLAIIVILWIGGKEVDGGLLTQGAVVALVNYMSQILVELIKLSNLIIQLTKALACADRIQKVFEMPATARKTNRSKIVSEITHTTGHAIPVIQFKQVDFCYPKGQTNSLSGITFEAYVGETIGVIGSTGSGKSTLVNLIPGFYPVTEGKICMDGINIEEYEPNLLLSRIGIVPQEVALCSGTVRENLCWGKKNATESEICSALKTAQALSFIEELPQGIDTVLTQNAKNLSGGQRQRLTIARALLKHPSILILDDSSSALDMTTDAALRRALLQKQGNTVILMVSQRVSTIKHADKIIVMEDGAMVGFDTHRELLRTCDVYQEICLSQLTKEEVYGYA
ncbi:MAG: ABC transporter ATP-binding protein [Lachnospiraceae bacterium]